MLQLQTYAHPWGAGLPAQVGIVALNLIGEPLSGGAGGGVGSQRTGAPTARQPHTDLALDMGVDSKTATVIRELHAKKEAAVANEDYDEAKQLKVMGGWGRKTRSCGHASGCSHEAGAVAASKLSRDGHCCHCRSSDGGWRWHTYTTIMQTVAQT